MAHTSSRWFKEPGHHQRNPLNGNNLRIFDDEESSDLDEDWMLFESKGARKHREWAMIEVPKATPVGEKHVANEGLGQAKGEVQAQKDCKAASVKDLLM